MQHNIGVLEQGYLLEILPPVGSPHYGNLLTQVLTK